MTTPSQDSQVFDSYVPVYDEMPETWEDSRGVVVEQLKRLANAVNIREIGWFLDEELLSGKQFIPSTVNVKGLAPQWRSVFRKVVNFGALPNAGTKSVSHGVVFDANFTQTAFWISATDPVNFKAFSLAYWAISTPGDIIINMDATNINVTTKSDYSGYTRSYVTIEYLLEQ